MIFNGSKSHYFVTCEHESENVLCINQLQRN